MAEITRKPCSIRLSDEEIALLPPAESISESVRQLIIDHARHGPRLDAILDELASLKKAIAHVDPSNNATQIAGADQAETSVCDPSVALRMILFNLRAVYEGTLRTEAVTTAALHGIVDPDVTGEALEGLLKTRFDAHMSQLWPLFVAENDRGLRSLSGAKRRAQDVEKPIERTPQAPDGDDGAPATEAPDNDACAAARAT